MWINICFTSFPKPIFPRYKLDFEFQIFSVVSDLILVIIGYFFCCFLENSWVGQDAEHYGCSLLWVDAINSANDSFIQLLFKSLLLRFCSERDWREKRRETSNNHRNADEVSVNVLKGYSLEFRFVLFIYIKQ